MQMAEGKAKDRWQHTSVVLSMLANCHRDAKKTKPFKPSDFDPFSQSKPDAIEIDETNIHELRRYFTGA
jgi:hypothetical protein